MGQSLHTSKCSNWKGNPFSNKVTPFFSHSMQETRYICLVLSTQSHSCMLFQFPKTCVTFQHKSVIEIHVERAQTSDCGWPTHFLLLWQKKKADVRETAKLPPAVSVITGTPINSAVDFLYSTSLLSGYMTLSSTASTCTTPWKMWLIKVFSAICKFLGNSDFCDIFNAHKIYSLIFSCTLKCESHWTFIWMLIWQISLLFVQLRILKMVRNTFFKFTLQSILCTLHWF